MAGILNKSKTGRTEEVPRDRRGSGQHRRNHRWLSAGPRQLTDQELLEVLLASGGRIPAAVTAASLLSRYGSLGALAQLDPVVLGRQPGVGFSRATRLAAAFELAHRRDMMENPALISVRSPADVVPFLRESFRECDREHFLVLHLDTRHRILATETVSIGCLNATIVHPREVFSRAVTRSVAAVIVAHNHPSGCAEPSRDDLELTSRLDACGRLLGIELLDHLVIGHTDYTSIREYGWPTENHGFLKTAEG
jgi:DNA repair protein RadC